MISSLAANFINWLVSLVRYLISDGNHIVSCPVKKNHSLSIYSFFQSTIMVCPSSKTSLTVAIPRIFITETFKSSFFTKGTFFFLTYVDLANKTSPGLILLNNFNIL